MIHPPRLRGLRLGPWLLLMAACSGKDAQPGGSGGEESSLSGGTKGESTGGVPSGGGTSAGGSQTGGASSGGSDAGGADDGAGGEEQGESGGANNGTGGSDTQAYQLCDTELGQQDNPGCSAIAICRSGICTPPCENDLLDGVLGTGDDCLAPATGNADLSCGLGYCTLRCANDLTCPDGMICEGSLPGAESCARLP